MTLWKRPRLAAMAISLALMTLLVSSNAWVAKSLVRSLEWQYLPLSPLPTAQAIVVLGGATKSPAPPRVTVDVNEAGDRILYAAQLYRQNKAPLIIVTGGRIDWSGSSSPESVDMADVLTSIGIPSQGIIQEPEALNTYENAVNVKQILTARGINKVLLVTSAMHMPRSVQIFQAQGMDVIPAPTDFQVTKNEMAAITRTPKAAILNLFPDVNNLQLFTTALKEYIGIWVYGWRGWL